MGLVGVAAENGGDTEWRGAVDEPSKSFHTLVLLGAESGVPDEETAQMPARQAQGFGSFINGSFRKQFEGESHLSRGRLQEQWIGLSPKHGVDQASGAPTPDDVIKREFSVSKLVGRSPEQGRHCMGLQPQAERRRPGAEAMDHRPVSQPDGDGVGAGDDHIGAAVGDDPMVRVDVDALLPEAGNHRPPGPRW